MSRRPAGPAALLNLSSRLSVTTRWPVTAILYALCLKSNTMISIMPRSHGTWNRALQDGLVSGTVASVVSTVSLAILGKAELDKAAAPINGPSQWVWGKHAPYENRFSLRYTVTGYAIHHAASIFWASLYEKLRQRLGSPPDRTAPVASAIVITATAYAVDFHVIPKRLTPGFEHRLSKRSLQMVYGAFAIGLAAVALMDRHGKAPMPKRPNR